MTKHGGQKTYNGVVRKGAVVLDRGAKLPEGIEVDVTVLTEPSPSAKNNHRARSNSALDNGHSRRRSRAPKTSAK